MCRGALFAVCLILRGRNITIVNELGTDRFAYRWFNVSLREEMSTLYLMCFYYSVNHCNPDLKTICIESIQNIEFVLLIGAAPKPYLQLLIIQCNKISDVARGDIGWTPLDIFLFSSLLYVYIMLYHIRNTSKAK